MHSRREILAATVTASLAAPGGDALQPMPSHAFAGGSGTRAI